MASSASQVLPLGARVTVPKSGDGHIRFVGQTAFAAGKWVGVELDDANGKNDGSVQEKRYFDCEPLHGVFVRPSQIKVLIVPASEPEGSGSGSGSLGSRRPGLSQPPRPTPSSSRTSTSSGRPISVSGPSATARPAAIRTGSTVSGRSSGPSPNPRSPSPQKSAAVASRLSRLGSTTTTPRALGTPPRLPGQGKTAVSRGTAGPSSARRDSITGGPGALPSTPSRTPFTATRSTRSGSVRAPTLPVDDWPTASEVASENGAPDNHEGARPSSTIESEASAQEAVAAQTAPTSDPFSLESHARRKREETVPLQVHEETVAKLRILETKRAEERERIKDLERYKEEAEGYLQHRPKLQAKLVEQANELKELRVQNKDLELERKNLESRNADMADELELALMERESAELLHETADSHSNALKEREAELQTEIQTLREENARLESGLVRGDGQPLEPGSLELAVLNKQIARLKEVLGKVRDAWADADIESKKRISELEKELDLTTDLQNMYDDKASRLEVAQAQVEDLKIQLDDALGAEDMLVQLTERNLTLTEKIEEMHVIIEDLEAIKELNDELEEGHIDNEKQMQEEIDLKDFELRRQRIANERLEESVAEYDATIGQFRDLVVGLQNELEGLREQQTAQQTESRTLNDQSQAVMNLNLKLQTTVMKSRVKAIDLELRRLDATQATEHLKIAYLSPAFFEADGEAVEALLFFERLAYKADLVSSVLEQANDVGEALNGAVPDTLVEVCETRTKLARFSGLTKRFAANLKRCPSEVFLKVGRIYHELDEQERRFDVFIDLLRREELRPADCGQEVDRFVAQIGHLAEMNLGESDLDLGEQELAQTILFDLDLDTVTAAAGFSKQQVAVLSKDPDVSRAATDSDLAEVVFAPLQQIIDSCRACKILARKNVQRIEDLIQSSKVVRTENADPLYNLTADSQTLAIACSQLAERVGRYCAGVRSSKGTFDLEAFGQIVQECTAGLGGKPPLSLGSIALYTNTLSTDLKASTTAITDPEHVAQVSFLPPWASRASSIQQDAAVNTEAERKVHKLNEDIKELIRELRTKDQALQESTVKIELMDKKVEAIKKQSDAISELEAELVKSKKQEKAYEEAMETLQSDLDAMEQENVKMKQNNAASARQGHATASALNEPDGTAIATGLDTLHLLAQVESLRGAVRFLRSENSFIKSQDILRELEALPQYTQKEEDQPNDHLRVMAEESKVLFREAIALSSSPRVVDLSLVKPGHAWQSSRLLPENQYASQKRQVNVLGRRWID